MTTHKCRTYFRIVGDFDVHHLLEKLDISPSRMITKGTKLPTTGKPATWSEIDIGYNDHYLTDINEMIRITICDLLPKIDLLAELKSNKTLKYYLEVVPEIVSDCEEIKPMLSLDSDIIAFLYQTGTEYDLDYYVY